jgi:hypothetical protein
MFLVLFDNLRSPHVIARVKALAQVDSSERAQSKKEAEKIRQLEGGAHATCCEASKERSEDDDASEEDYEPEHGMQLSCEHLYCLRFAEQSIHVFIYLLLS